MKIERFLWYTPSTLYTLTLIRIFSVLHISQAADEESLLKNQEFL